MATTEAGYRPGDRVEWNPTVDEWLPATVCEAGQPSPVSIVLDENGQVMQVRPRNIRPLDPPVGDGPHEVEGIAAVPDTSEAGESLLSAVKAIQAANRRRLEELARDLESVPDPALKMRVAGLVAHREQCCAAEHDCYADWELADLRWVLARRAESAGSIHGVIEFGEGDPEHDGPVRDGYGCRWLPAVCPGDGFRGWAHRPPGPNLPPVWMTWGQLTIQRGPLTAVDADRA